MFSYNKDSYSDMENITVSQAHENKYLALCKETYTLKKLFED